MKATKQLPDENRADPLDWVRHAVFYQIFPDRFARGREAGAQAGRFEPWGAPPTRQGYKGGDLWGVRERLGYLQDLGVTALYLNPVFQSAANHRYHTCDYHRVDPLLGGDEAFDALLAEAHRRGLRIVLDGVFNHTGRGFFPFHDILENGPASPWLDWYEIDGFPLSAYSGRRKAGYACWYGLRALPKLNHRNPAVREYLMRVGEHWVRRGIDGWRLDVPMEIDAPGFWEEFRQRVKAVNPEAYLVGEVWGEAGAWLDGTRFDGVMNYPLAVATLAFAGGDRIDRRLAGNPQFRPCPPLSAREYAGRVQDLLDRCPGNTRFTQLNLLGSHDTPRLLTMVRGDRRRASLAAFLLFTLPGAPCVYYGDEVGLPGRKDPDCRRGFPERAAWNERLLETFRRLIALRQSLPALRTGSFRTLHAGGRLFAFERKLAGEQVIAAVNAGETPAPLPLPVGFRNLGAGVRVHASGAWAESAGGQPELSLPPLGWALLARVPAVLG